MEKVVEKIRFPETGAEMLLYEDDILLVHYARATYNLEENNRETRWVRDAFHEMAEKYPEKKFLILMDVTEPGSGEEMSDEVKDIYLKLLKDQRIERVAVFGQTWGFQLFLDLFATMSGNNKLRSFPNKQKALAWLKKKRKNEV